MTIHFHREMDVLKNQILGLGSMVEEQVYHAVRAVEERDPVLAKQVIERDDSVDQKEIEIEEECLKVMALHQPVAIDLRLLVSILKINSDLERIGDMAVNIAETVSYIAKEQGESEVLFDYHAMAGVTRALFRKSLDSLINLDEELASQVCKGDDEVDAFHRRFYSLVEEMVQKEPARVGLFLRYLLISRNLERIGDHATNIAEDVLYMVRGRILRHNAELRNNK